MLLRLEHSRRSAWKIARRDSPQSVIHCEIWSKIAAPGGAAAASVVTLRRPNENFGLGRAAWPRRVAEPRQPRRPLELELRLGPPLNQLAALGIDAIDHAQRWKITERDLQNIKGIRLA